jgi:hypothetical protein
MIGNSVGTANAGVRNDGDSMRIADVGGKQAGSVMLVTVFMRPPGLRW